MAKKVAKPEKKSKVARIRGGRILADTEPVPPEPPVPSKKELAQQALDMLGTATPSVGSDGKLVMWVRGPDYKGIEARLVAIVNS